MRKIVAPLVLLSSIALLTSCGEQKPVVPAVPVTTTETPAPVMVDVAPTPEPVAPVATGTVESGSTTAPTVATTPVVLTRTETVSYKSPAGQDEIEFSVTVTDGVITTASAKALATNDASKYNQDNFIKALSEKVVGKTAKDLDVDAIGGASLTTTAFETFAHSF